MQTHTQTHTKKKKEGRDFSRSASQRETPAFRVGRRKVRPSEGAEPPPPFDLRRSDSSRKWSGSEFLRCVCGACGRRCLVHACECDNAARMSFGIVSVCMCACVRVWFCLKLRLLFVEWSSGAHSDRWCKLLIAVFPAAEWAPGLVLFLSPLLLLFVFLLLLLLWCLDELVSSSAIDESWL